MQTNENKPMNAADQAVKPNTRRKTVLTVLSLALLLVLHRLSLRWSWNLP